MVILRIEHKISNFEEWKKVFDSDPIGRRKSGVKRYRIYRPADDSNYVIIDLEFDNHKEAEAALTALRNVWKNVGGSVIFNPETRIFDIAETLEY